MKLTGLCIVMAVALNITPLNNFGITNAMLAFGASDTVSPFNCQVAIQTGEIEGTPTWESCVYL